MNDDIILIGTLVLVKGAKGKSYIKFSSGNSFRALNNKSQGALLRECSAVMEQEAGLTYPAPVASPEDVA